MRVPIRKPGKYTHDKADPNMTEKKYQELKNKLERILKITRPPLIEEVKRLALMGDFSDNAAYSIAKGRLRGLNQKIIEIEDLLKRAQIINHVNSGIVQLGTFVTVESDGKTRRYQILGSTEVNLDLGVISHNSPIGSALMGKRVGDEVKVEIGGKTKTYAILKVE